MAFVRWSSDDHKSDVYAYEHVNGYFALHVAGRKRVGEIVPSPCPSTIQTDPDWWEKYRAYQASLDACELVPIGLPHDGETFELATLEALRDKLLELKAVGYYVPDWCIESINEELKESGQ